MKLSDEVRTWLLTGSDCEFDYYGYGDRIAALEAERNELASELKKHCGCEFDPITAECTVTCQTHKRVEDELAAAKTEIEHLEELANSIVGY